MPAATATHTHTASFNGSSLAIDYTAYLGQHGLVYNTVPRHPHSAMAVGDGRLAAFVWCPSDSLSLRVAYTDPSLFTGPEHGGEPPAIGCTLAFRSEPSPLVDPARFRQRLSLQTATVDTEATSDGGAFRAETWVAAEHGVLVVQYSDSVVRSQLRVVQLHADTGARPFAIGDHIGVIEATAEHRLAILCAVVGSPAVSGWSDARTPRFAIPQTRGSAFTAFIAAGVSRRDEDPIAVARSRIAAIIECGLDEAAGRHRRHWRRYWDMSFLHVETPDTLGGYLEHLWFLHQYHLGACGDFTMAGAAGDVMWRRGDARGNAMAGSAAVDRCACILPAFAAGRDHLAHDWLNRTAAHTPAEQPLADRAREEMSQPDAETDLCRRLELLLPMWLRWEYGQERDWLRYRVYPALRALAREWDRRVRGLQAPGSAALVPLRPSVLNDAGLSEQTQARLRWLLSAASSAADALFEDAHLREGWCALLSVLEQGTPSVLDAYPLGTRAADSSDLAGSFEEARFSPHQLARGRCGPGPAVAARALLPDALVWALEERVSRHQLYPQGLYCDWADSGQEIGRPQLAPGADIAAALQEMCLQSQRDSIVVAPCLPPRWDVTFSFRARGGFRVMAQTSGGEPIWVAIVADNDGLCRVRNPWQTEARVLAGHREVVRTNAEVIEFDSQRRQVYIVDRREAPLSRMLRFRLTARQRHGAHIYGYRQIGLD